MRLPLLLLVSCFFLSGCEPSFKEEYEATLKELQSTQAELLEAKDKLRAADSEIRHNIFTLMRRASNHLRSTDIETNQVKLLSQELAVHIESYLQLSPEPDHVSVNATFFAEKLTTAVELLENSKSAYDRRFTECLRGIENQKNSKNELNNMLCEVQADVAKDAIDADLDSSIYALTTLLDEQLKIGRQGSSSTVQPKALEQRFRVLIAKSLDKKATQ